MKNEHKVLILGGGVAGAKCALELQKKNIKNLKITLISDRPHFELAPHAHAHLQILLHA